MSILSDFSLYYRNSHACVVSNTGFRQPFRIDSVDIRRSISSNLTSNEYDTLIHNTLMTQHDQVPLNLCFAGILTKEDGRREEAVINMDNPRLELSIPELGYHKVGSRWKWLSYRLVHFAKKGLCRDRILPAMPGGDVPYASIYNWSPTPENPTRDLVMPTPATEGGTTYVEYRGFRVALVRGNVITLQRPVAHLQEMITAAFQQGGYTCQLGNN